MPKIDVKAGVATARSWATAHVVAAVAIGIVVGFLIRSLL